MNTIFKIARAELRNLFYSPVAWFLAIIFMIQCAVFYTDGIYAWAKNQELYMKASWFKAFDRSLTGSVFLSGGVFTSIIQNLYLFIPLLTMGILSREISNGSIKLLYSSPIKTRHIVFGKYLALMLYSLILLLLAGIFVLSANFNIKEVDNGLLLSGILGVYLLVCAFAAIGFFMSSLTTYQIVSAIGTFIIVFILSKIGGLWQDVDFVRDLTYFLSMPSRTRNMLAGLITTKDVLYYLIIIGMFMGFTLLKLKSGRESKSKFITASKYLGLVVFALMLGYITSRPQFVGYLDATSAQSNTIHPRVQKIVKELGDEPLEVTLYTNLLGNNVYYGLPSFRNNYLSTLWEKYLRFKPNIEFKYELYYDLRPDNELYKIFPGKTLEEIAEDVAKSGDYDLTRFQTPEQMKAKIDLEQEDYALVMQLKYKGKTTLLRTYPDPAIWPGEEHVAASIARLLGNNIPKVLFTTGNLERSIEVKGERGFSGSTIEKTSRRSLINNGFDIDTIELDTQDIPSDSVQIAALVLADPKTALSTVKKQKIQQYIDAGGNIMLLGESGKEAILNPVLAPLGVQLMSGVLIQVSKHNAPDIITAYLTKSSAELAEEDILLLLKTAAIEDTVFLAAESIAPITNMEENTAFTKKPLIITKPNTWLKRGKLIKDSIPPLLNIQEGDVQMDAFTVATALTRQINRKEQRIVVAGDADFISNRFSGGEGYFARALYSWMNYNEYPMYGPVPPPKDNLMRISPSAAAWQKKIYVWLLPAIFTLIAIMVLVRRKRK